MEKFELRPSEKKAHEFLAVSEELLAELDKAVKLFEKESEQRIDKLEKREQFIYVGILLTLFLETIFFMLPVIRKYNSMMKELKSDLHENKVLLNQYKDAVDTSSIVSKTDLQGNITYVNDNFCQLSGYSREELIGNKHSIIRHPDVSKNIFKDMWKKIKKKKTWHGEVKNRKKDGSYYVVISTILPILNSQDEIVEYMAIRYDITDIYNLREEIAETQKEIIFTMGAIGETRSQETGNHVKRVAEYSRILASGYGLDEEYIELLAQASPMHDIGKVGIPDNILNKPGKLTEDEFVIIRKHSEIGYEMLKHSSRPLMKLAASVALEHHEYWDGNGGYPNNLKGEEISIGARITAVADVFDALGSDRCYKKAWDDEKTFEFLKSQRGKQFDPKLVDIFFDNLEAILEIREKFRDV